MKTLRAEILPSSLPPIGINREQAAELVGIGASLFDKAVEAGTMPAPRMIGGRLIYDVAELVEAFRKLPHKGGAAAMAESLDEKRNATNPWD